MPFAAPKTAQAGSAARCLCCGPAPFVAVACVSIAVQQQQYTHGADHSKCSAILLLASRWQCQAVSTPSGAIVSGKSMAMPASANTVKPCHTALAEQLPRISHLERWGSMGQSLCVGKRPCLPNENCPGADP